MYVYYEQLIKSVANDDVEQISLKKSQDKKEEEIKKEYKCQVCLEEFESRNKLFEHINKEKHAILKPAQNQEQAPLSHNAVKKNKRLLKAKK
jgi:hypothetical protein